jgi:hypothetical protein
MTQEEFKRILDKGGYSYRDKGGYSYREEADKLVVTHVGHVVLGSLEVLPPGVEFSNEGHVELGSLGSLKKIPPGVEFKNKGYIVLGSFKKIPLGWSSRIQGMSFWAH